MTQYVKKLPAVFQTVTEKKFFDATFDQVLSKKDSDYLAGFLGRRIPGTYNPITDFYIPEPSKNRTWWQLEPTAFARNEDTTKTNVFFYEDLLENIEYYGGNTLNQDRLFNSEYYSFGPPIDYDMFINFHDYYWVDRGLPAITIYGVMASDIIGQPSFTTPSDAVPANFTLSTGMSVILADDPDYAEEHTVENKGGCTGIELVPEYTDITAGSTFEFLPWDGTLALSTGRVIDNRHWDTMTWDVQYQPTLADYITIERGSIDRNAWSRTNKWFHIETIKSVIAQTGEPFPAAASRALRPIIQFSANLLLYRSGSHFKEEIQYGFLDDSTDQVITLADMQGMQLNDINIEYGIGLDNGSLVCFFGDDTIYSGSNRVNQYIFVATVELDSSVTFSPYSSNPIVVDGDIVLIKANAPANGGKVGETWFFENDTWQLAANNKVSLNQPPLFQLFDHNGVKLDDVNTYPESSFAGNKIFSYKINEVPGATVDPVLGFPIVYTGLGQSSDIVFQNNLIVNRYVYGTTRLPINGYYYYKDITNPILENGWNLYQPCPCDDITPPPPCNCLETSKQRVIDRFVVGYGSEYKFKLSVTPYGYPSAPDLIVSVNSTEIKPLSEQENGYVFETINERIYVDLSLYLSALLETTQAQPPVVEIHTYTQGLLYPEEPGYYSIPQQLEANPNQEEVSDISGSNLIQHFSSIIANQIGFTGTAFGGPNNYRDSRKNNSVGQFILQNTSPLLKTMLISQRGDLSFIDGIRFSNDEYSKFKNKYIRIAQQLINQEFNPAQYNDGRVLVSYWVDEILNIANVSKDFSNAFAYSYMIANGSPYATQTFDGPVSGTITLDTYIDLSDPKNALYIYEVDSTGQERLLLIGKDYEIVSTNLEIEIELIAPILSGSSIYVALYKNPLPAYIPSTPSKIGAYSVYVPRMEWDSTYISPTWVIMGHDGSKTIAYGTPTEIDYRDQLLLELERRIYNLIEYRFRHEYYLPIRIESVKQGFFRTARYSREEYLQITESYLNKWSAKNRANYRSNDWYTLSETTPVEKLWKLYNYRDAVSTSDEPLNLPGNWKGIFQYMYDTINPDTRPWEMLGFSDEPSWWRYEYGNPVINTEGQEVWTSAAAAAHNMYADLEAGIIRQGPSAIYDPLTEEVQPQEIWARPGLSNYIPVDSAGEIIPIINVNNPSASLFDIAYSGNPYEPFDGFDKDWIYGDGAPVEQAWMSTSAYAFSVQEFLFLMRPAPFGELLWDTFGTELSPGYITVPGSAEPVMSNRNWQYVQNNKNDNGNIFFAWMRPKNADQIVHAESIDSDIQVRYGYQRWISDRILFLGKNVSSTFGQKVRTLNVNLANKLAGFTNKDTTNIYIEAISPGSSTNTLIVPSNNFDVILSKGPVVDTYSYSGVVIRALADGTFVVYGYDLLSSEFTVLERTDAKLIDISVGGTPADFQYFTTGATYSNGDIVRHNGIYYQSLATQTVQKFENGSWLKLKTLPTVGGVSVTYKPVSGKNVTKVPYGTILKSAQEVFDLLIGWGAYLETRGWQFTEVNADTNQLSDWLYSAKQFLFWLNTSWSPDASIQLSPLANKATLIAARGYPDNVETMSNGIYSILDKYGVAISPNETVTDREGQLISVSPANLSTGGIYFLQVNVSETEHILIFDNLTSFNDIVYSPLLRARQQRLRFNGFRSNGWYGKMEAPGYLVIDNELVPNFDTIVDAMRYYYDPNTAIDNPSIEDLGRHLIGYESKSYLDNLQVSNDVQYLFYKGAIRQKGTTQALDKLFRSTLIQTDESIEVYEEWALKLGDFGNTVEQVSTEFILRPEQNNGENIVARLNYVPSVIGFVKQINIFNAEIVYDTVPTISISAPTSGDPLSRTARAYAVLNAAGMLSRIDITDEGYGYLSAPSVEIVSPQNSTNIDKAYSVWQGNIVNDSTLDNIIDIDIDETDIWTVRPADPTYSLEFPLTNNINYPIPNAGYVNFNDVDFSSFDVEQTAINWGTTDFNPAADQTVWVAKTFTEDWDVYKLVDISPNYFSIVADSLDYLYLKTEDTYLIQPQLTGGNVTTDFGNLIVLQTTESDAVVSATVSPGQTEQAVVDEVVIPIAATAIAEIDNTGSITGIVITESGNSYTSTPDVSIDAAPKIQAELSASIVNGQVYSLNIINAGLGYVSPIIEISAPDAENARAETMIGSDGSVISISVVYSGIGYTTLPTITIEPPASGTQATAVVSSLVGGKVIAIQIVEAGTGYTTSPRIFISAPTVVQATATAVVSGTKITGYTITNAGAGYSATPIVSVTAPDAVDAVIDVVSVVSGSVTGITLVSGTGTGYSNIPVVGIQPCDNAGSIVSISLSNPGIFYPKNAVPVVTIIGDGVGASAQAVMESGDTGVIDYIEIISGGSDYSYAEVQIESPVESGTASILSVDVVSDGSGYVSIPNVYISDSTGTGASLRATILNGKVNSIEVISGGNNYTSPVITLDPPTNVVPTENYAVGISYDRAEGGYNYYKLVTLTGDQITSQNISNYQFFTQLLLFKTMRFLTIDDVPTDSYITNGDKFWCDGYDSNTGNLSWAVYKYSYTPSSEDITLRTTDSEIEFESAYQAVGVPNSAVGGTFNTSIVGTDVTFINNLAINVGPSVSSVIGTDEINSNTSPQVVYYEFLIGTDDPTYVGAFIQAFGPPFNPDTEYGGPLSCYYTSSGTIGGYGSSSSGNSTYGAGDVIGVVIDFGSYVARFFKNGVQQTSTANLTNNVGIYAMAGALAGGSGGSNTGGSTYTVYRKQESLIDSKLFESATIFDAKSKDMIALLPVYDPFKNILPAPAIQNITYMALKDPARYNVTPSETLFSDNIIFGERQVGQLWWDLSQTRYVYYEQPRWLNDDGTVGENATSNLEYRRRNWGNLFPGSSVAIYEWVKSRVPPSQYTGSGIPRTLDTYVQLVSINKFTNIVETNYYFWVLDSTDKPNIPNRTLAARDVSRILQSPKSQNFMFFAPIQETNNNNSYMFYNVQELLSYRGNNIQVQYRLSNRDDQAHTQWSLFRENDTLSLVSNQYWNKMVDSLCGYTKVLPVSNEYNNSIPVDGGEVLPVPDPSLGEEEKYGISYRPRQSMFVRLSSARKVFVQSANNILMYIPVRDDNPGWDDNVSTSIYWTYTNWYKLGYENVVPTIVYRTLSEATAALSAGKLNVTDIVQVTDGTPDGRFILYSVVKANANVDVLSLEEVCIENSAIKLLDTIYTVSDRYNLSVELRELLNAFRTEVMIDENLIDQNNLFSSMINYVLSEQKTPDWVFKTSYIYIKENNIPLTQSSLYLPDQTDNIIAYIQDAKPYHTQIRDYTSKYTITDIADGTAIDFHKMKTIIKFGPAALEYFSSDDNIINSLFGWDLNQGPYNLPWDSQYEVAPGKLFVSSWDNGYHIDNNALSPVPINILQQFISGNPTDADFVPTPGSDWPSVITCELATPDPDKKGYSQLYPYTFSYSELTLNDPQSFVAPETIVAVRADNTFLLSGYDYYTEYNESDNSYTIYFYNNPAVYTSLVAFIWFDGGALQNIQFNTYRNELALGFPEDNLVMNVDTKLLVNDISGETIGITPDTFTAECAPLVGWGTSWDSINDPVVGGIITSEGGTTSIPWDTSITPVELDYTVSSRQDSGSGEEFFVRNDDAAAGILVQDILAPTAETYNIGVIVVSASADIFPDIENDHAAVWIDGERIEYRTKTEIEPGVWELGELRRGTAGTALTAHYVIDPETLGPNKVWVERNNVLSSSSGSVVWQATNTSPDITTEVQPDEYSNVTAVPLGGLWYSQTSQATFLKQGQGKSIL